MLRVTVSFSPAEKHKGNIHYLKQAKLPEFPRKIFKQLETDLSVKDFQTALKSMPLGKAPGLDSYRVLYYKTFSNILVPPSGGLRPLIAHITVIPKPGQAICKSNGH